MTKDETLYILWTNGDPVTVRNMVFMYATNSLRYKWWEKVHVIVWGAATKLLVEDKEIQKLLREFLDLQGEVSVCRMCAENLNMMGEVKKMETMGKLKVFYVGEFFTKILKDGEKLLTV